MDTTLAVDFISLVSEFAGKSILHVIQVAIVAAAIQRCHQIRIRAEFYVATNIDGQFLENFRPA